VLSLADTAISGFDHLIPVALIFFFPLMILDFIVMDRLVRLEYIVVTSLSVLELGVFSYHFCWLW